MTKVTVIDIGKTNAKLALVELATLSEIDVRKTPNVVLRDGPYPHFDVERLWGFITESLRDLNTRHGVDAISVTTHGATAVLVDRDGGLALPILDYEFDGPEKTRADYEPLRPGLAETGSPALPIGLNLGAQIFWQQQKFPDEFKRVTSIMMYPQYWSFRLSGVRATEVTSLGTHTDLWEPAQRKYSSMVARLKWDHLFPPIVPAQKKLGVITSEVAEATGIDPACPVYCGIHDSNASLLPHLMHRKAPFTVVSTGTWVISLAVGGSRTELDPEGDSLFNVNAFGDPVMTARFMGGREFEVLMAGHDSKFTDDDVQNVLSRRLMYLPSAVEGGGPFSHRKGRWLSDVMTDGERYVAVSFYLALVTASSIHAIGAASDTIVEGAFSSNELLLTMLATVTGRRVLRSRSVTGTSAGAALLVGSSEALGQQRDEVVAARPVWLDYANAWSRNVEKF